MKPLVPNLMLLAQHYQNCNPKNLANVSAVPLVSLYLMRRRSDQFLHASQDNEEPLFVFFWG